MSARIGLGRAGVSVPTDHLLTMNADLALARDAVRTPFDVAGVGASLQAAGIDFVVVATQAHDREDYLRRPDRGRLLAPESLSDLKARDDIVDLVVIISDGLSATAANTHAAEFVVRMRDHLPALRICPVVIAPLARVGLLNDVGQALGARAAAIVLGERPGSSAPDSLSLYFEMSPASGLTDADRNCISNIRPAGLPLEVAATHAAALIAGGLRAGISGTALKMEHDPPPSPISP